MLGTVLKPEKCPIMPSDKPSVLKIGIAGLGVVGSEVARQLSHRSAELAAVAGCGLEVTAVSARSRMADRGFSMDNIS